LLSIVLLDKKDIGYYHRPEFAKRFSISIRNFVKEAPVNNPHARHRPPVGASEKPRRALQLQEAIESIVKEIPRGTHLTAPEVFRRAREQGLQVSLSTVYRCLNLLQAHGNIGTISGDHGRRYEARDDDHDHDHLICVKCGLTIEFTDELIKGFGRTLAERKGFVHANSRFDILGICKTCKAKDEDHKISSCIGALEISLAQLQEAQEKAQAAIALMETRKIARANDVLIELNERIENAQAEAANAIAAITQDRTI
jgi:Fur family ferric uptake transcriptional regulator